MQISIERLGDLDVPTPAPPSDTGAEKMELEKEDERIAKRKQQKENPEQKTRKQEYGTEKAAKAGAKRNWHTTGLDEYIMKVMQHATPHLYR